MQGFGLGKFMRESNQILSSKYIQREQNQRESEYFQVAQSQDEWPDFPMRESIPFDRIVENQIAEQQEEREDHSSSHKTSSQESMLNLDPHTTNFRQFTQNNLIGMPAKDLNDLSHS